MAVSPTLFDGSSGAVPGQHAAIPRTAGRGAQFSLGGFLSFVLFAS